MRGWYPPSSSGVHVLRLVMWTLTTPFMVYLLSKLSDFRRDKVSCGAGAQQVGRGGGPLHHRQPLEKQAAFIVRVVFLRNKEQAVKADWAQTLCNWRGRLIAQLLRTYILLLLSI